MYEGMIFYGVHLQNLRWGHESIIADGFNYIFEGYSGRHGVAMIYYYFSIFLPRVQLNTATPLAQNSTVGIRGWTTFKLISR